PSLKTGPSFSATPSCGAALSGRQRAILTIARINGLGVRADQPLCLACCPSPINVVQNPLVGDSALLSRPAPTSSLLPPSQKGELGEQVAVRAYFCRGFLSICEDGKEVIRNVVGE